MSKSMSYTTNKLTLTERYNLRKVAFLYMYIGLGNNAKCMPSARTQVT